MYLGTSSNHCYRRHGAGQNKRRDYRRLVILRVDARGPEHRGIEGQWRVGINQAGDDAVLIYKVVTKYNLGHVDGILGP
jgi:hypothetical protein